MNDIAVIESPPLSGTVIKPAAQFESAAQEVMYLRGLVLDLVEQNCYKSSGKDRQAGEYDIVSGFISTHKAAIVYLVEVGLLRLVDDVEGTRQIYAHTVR